MLKRILILLTLLLFGAAFPVLGQTVVNLSVTDTPDNQTWNNGTWSVKLQPPAGNLSQTNTFTLLSGGGSLAAQNGTLSGTATAAISLPANANIGPNGTVWQLTVCPQASAGCFQQSITVSTSSPQTLAINPPSIRINLATATPPISAYATGEISGAVIGSQFYLLGTGIQVCSVISGNACTTWTAAASGSSAALAGNSNAIYASPVCGQPTTGNCFFVNANGQWVIDAVYSNSATTCGGGTVPAGTCITSATANFSCPGSIFPCTVGGDNGKIEFLTTGSVWQGNGTVDSQGTIVKVWSASAAQISAAHTSGGTGANFAWCSDDTANLIAAATALNVTSTASPGTLILPAGGAMCVQQMPFKFTALHGYELAIIGQGPNTVIMPTPNFDGTTCAAGTNAGCIFNDVNGGIGSTINTNDYLANFTVFGMGQSLPSGSAGNSMDNKSIVAVPALALVQNVNLVGWGWNYKSGAAPFLGLFQPSYSTTSGNIINGAGNVNWQGGLALGVAANRPILIGNFFGVAKLEPCVATGYVRMEANTCYANNLNANNIALYVNGGNVTSTADTFNGIIYGDTNGYGYFDSQISQATTTNGVFWNAGANFFVKHALNLTASGGGVSVKQTSGTFTDEGGNVFSQGFNITGGSVFGVTNSAAGTVCATGNFALTSGWGTSSVASVAANGNIQGCHVTITGAAGSAGPVLTWTYPSAPIVAPGSCHIIGVSGTLTGVTVGTPGATTVAFTFAGTPSAQTYVFDVGCP